MLNPGRLRERVTISRLVRTPDGQGGFSESWTTLATIWAAVEPYSVRYVVEGRQPEEDIRYRITVRRRSDLVPALGDRVTWSGRTLDVLAVVPDPERKIYTLECRERHL